MSLLQTTSLPPQRNSSSPRWASRNGLPLCKEDISHLPSDPKGSKVHVLRDPGSGATNIEHLGSGTYRVL
ncbi:hypothetical protein HYQ46_003895 [Verticillium longisporum]|nr:hypothetical protein HYQ46_003895 [Verticillium longisporum]